TAYVISPYTQTGSVDSTFYSSVSVLRTMELILGLPPLSQFDAAANPMSAAFVSTPNLRPFTAVPATLSLNAKKTANHAHARILAPDRVLGRRPDPDAADERDPLEGDARPAQPDAGTGPLDRRRGGCRPRRLTGTAGGPTPRKALRRPLLAGSAARRRAAPR